MEDTLKQIEERIKATRSEMDALVHFFKVLQNAGGDPEEIAKSMRRLKVVEEKVQEQERLLAYLRNELTNPSY